MDIITNHVLYGINEPRHEHFFEYSLDRIVGVKERVIFTGSNWNSGTGYIMHAS